MSDVPQPPSPYPPGPHAGNQLPPNSYQASAYQPNPYQPNPYGQGSPLPPARRSKVPWIVGIVVGVLLLGGLGLFTVVRGLQAHGMQVAARILGQMSDGQYGDIWEEATPAFKASNSEAKVVALLDGVEQAIGRPRSWTIGPASTRVENGVKSSSFEYAVVHERGESTITLDVDGKDRLLGFSVEGR